MIEELLAQPERDEIELLDILKALADAARLRLLAKLADGSFHQCSDWLPELGVHKSTLSHHLKVMRQAGVTSTRVIGREHEIRIRTDDLEARFPGLLGAILAGVAASDRVSSSS